MSPHAACASAMSSPLAISLSHLRARRTPGHRYATARPCCPAPRYASAAASVRAAKSGIELRTRVGTNRAPDGPAPGRNSARSGGPEDRPLPRRGWSRAPGARRVVSRRSDSERALRAARAAQYPQERGDSPRGRQNVPAHNRRAATRRDQIGVQPHRCRALPSTTVVALTTASTPSACAIAGQAISYCLNGSVERSDRRSQRLNLTERHDQLFGHGIADIGERTQTGSTSGKTAGV